MNFHVPSLQRSLTDVVAEYDAKLAGLADAMSTFKRAGDALKMSCTIAGVYGDVTIDTGNNYESALKLCLLKSAWKHIYSGLNIDRIASAKDKERWKHALEKPAPFTIDNIRGTFGSYILDPRGNILRGLAEVFCSLDQIYKSHEKVKIGVKGLPKRVILTNVGYSSSYGMNKLRDMLNAVAAYRGDPLVEHAEFVELDKPHSSIRKLSGEVTIRGLKIRKFGNGNAHVFFDPRTLRDVNKALAEFYGEVLPDTTDEKPAKPQASTAVSKDLQYYPTPVKLIEDTIRHHWSDSWFAGKKLIDPSCGCGRILDAAAKRGAMVYGIEVDHGRAAIARGKHHPVLRANFLETEPDPTFDIVFMNPPFYGKHYAKHVLHAWKYLKPGGTLIAILPITAREHGLLDHLLPIRRWSEPWHDLPVGAFSESGTNINTTLLIVHKPEEAK